MREKLKFGKAESRNSEGSPQISQMNADGEWDWTAGLRDHRDDGGCVGLGLAFDYLNRAVQECFRGIRSRFSYQCGLERGQGWTGEWSVASENVGDRNVIGMVSVLKLGDQSRNYEVGSKFQSSKAATRGFSSAKVIKSCNEEWNKRDSVCAKTADASGGRGSFIRIRTCQSLSQGIDAGCAQVAEGSGSISRGLVISCGQNLSQSRNRIAGLAPQYAEPLTRPHHQKFRGRFDGFPTQVKLLAEPQQARIEFSNSLRWPFAHGYPFHEVRDSAGPDMPDGVFCVHFGNPLRSGTQNKNPFTEEFSVVARLRIAEKAKHAGNDDRQGGGKKEELFAARNHHGKEGYSLLVAGYWSGRGEVGRGFSGGRRVPWPGGRGWMLENIGVCAHHLEANGFEIASNILWFRKNSFECCVRFWPDRSKREDGLLAGFPRGVPVDYLEKSRDGRFGGGSEQSKHYLRVSDAVVLGIRQEKLDSSSPRGRLIGHPGQKTGKSVGANLADGVTRVLPGLSLLVISLNVPVPWLAVIPRIAHIPGSEYFYPVRKFLSFIDGFRFGSERNDNNSDQEDGKNSQQLFPAFAHDGRVA